MKLSEGTESSRSSQKVDYSTWLTKQQAADAIGVSTKTVEKLAQEQQLQQARWRRPSGGPEIVVYHPDDVARIAQDRRPGPSAFVLPAVPATNGNGHGRQPVPAAAAGVTLARPMAEGDDVLRAVFAAALRAVTSETSEKPPGLFLTLAEASACSGLSETYLRRLIRERTLEAVRDRGWKVRRRDLEAL